MKNLNSFFNYTYEEITQLLIENNLNTSASSILFNWYYKKLNQEKDFSNISKKTQEFLNNNFEFEITYLETLKVIESNDGTVKFLFNLKDKGRIETVLIPFNQKYSICLSSQVGCAMKCSFCFTGTQKLKRNLETNEIILQYLTAYRYLKQSKYKNKKILNIVFMGQGEPLHNYEAVFKACRIFLSKHGTSVGNQKITISTSGYLPGLKEFIKEDLGVNLALSLHSADTIKRNELIPINQKYPLKELLKEIALINLRKKQFVTYEYVLIDGFNDTIDDAHLLGELLEGKPAYINIIPFNPFPGAKYKSPNMQTTESFKSILDGYKIPTLIRDVKGDDVLAACGQLNTI